MNLALFASLEALLGIPEIAGWMFVFVLGACIGSFLNVVIYRVPNELSLLPSSKCPTCEKPIRFYHNVPILGWLFLRGKCADCSGRISVRYPAIELLTALVFCLVYWQVGLTPYLPLALIFSAAVISLIFIDADHMILPNVITYPMFVIAIVVRVAYPLIFEGNYFSDTTYAPIAYLSDWPAWAVSLAGALFGALIGGGSLWLVGAVWKILRGVEAMGLGDVKLLMGIGAFLGWRLTILTIFVGAFTGALAGILVVMKQKEKDLQAQIPFGIFLGIGAIFAMLFGERVITWYLGMFA
jgi:leader peptidase (prepilin peptidase)/N-methyltransferase